VAVRRFSELALDFVSDAAAQTSAFERHGAALLRGILIDVVRGRARNQIPPLQGGLSVRRRAGLRGSS